MGDEGGEKGAPSRERSAALGATRKTYSAPGASPLLTQRSPLTWLAPSVVAHWPPPSSSAVPAEAGAIACAVAVGARRHCTSYETSSVECEVPMSMASHSTSTPEPRAESSHRTRGDLALVRPPGLVTLWPAPPFAGVVAVLPRAGPPRIAASLAASLLSRSMRIPHSLSLAESRSAPPVPLLILGAAAPGRDLRGFTRAESPLLLGSLL